MEMITNVLTAFIHVEKEDEDDMVKKEKKLVKNLKWAAHLSESKADPDITKGLFDSVEERLKGSGYQISQTPFGYFLDLEIKTPGYSLARIFKAI